MKIVTMLMFIATSLILGQESQTFQVSKSQSVQSEPADISWDDRFDLSFSQIHE